LSRLSCLTDVDNQQEIPMTRNVNIGTGVAVSMIAAASLIVGSKAWAATSSAVTTDTATSAPAQPGSRYFGHSGPQGPFLHIVHQLDLTSDQQQNIRNLLDNARQQRRAQMSSGHEDFAALLNPGDPNHAMALQTAESNAVNRIRERADLEQQIYALLTPAQQAKLPTILAEMQARMRQRREAHTG
jgi:periplasmic protein CpxP/Spy